jgi:hypothetical protein
MTRKFFGTMIVVASVAMSAPARAQSPVQPGYTDIGAVIGLGGLNGASLSFGGRLEHAFMTLPDMGGGTLGIQLSGDYYSFSQHYTGVYNYSWSYIPIGGTVNYHFKLDSDKFDPFIGLGLGYNIVSVSCGGFSGLCNGSYSSGIYVIAKAGARYFFQPNLALYADVGAGAALLNAGLTFKLK